MELVGVNGTETSVTGLTPGVYYTFSVTAENAVSSQDNNSNARTVRATANTEEGGIYISTTMLLYMYICSLGSHKMKGSAHTTYAVPATALQILLMLAYIPCIYIERSRQCCVNYYAQQLLRGFFVVCTTHMCTRASCLGAPLRERWEPFAGVLFPAIRRRRHLGLFVSSKSGDGSVTLRQPVSSAR